MNLSPAPAYLGMELAVKEMYFDVPSLSRPGTTHRVTCNPATRRPTSCDCEARRACWHVKMLLSGAHNLKPHIRFGLVEQTTEELIAAARVARAAHDERAAVAVASVADLYA